MTIIIVILLLCLVLANEGARAILGGCLGLLLYLALCALGLGVIGAIIFVIFLAVK